MLANLSIVCRRMRTCVVFCLGGWKWLNGCFTIQTNFDESSADLKQFAMEHRGWTPSSEELNFARVFSTAPWNEEQQYGGATYFQHLAENGAMFVKHYTFCIFGQPKMLFAGCQHGCVSVCLSHRVMLSKDAGFHQKILTLSSMKNFSFRIRKAFPEIPRGSPRSRTLNERG